MQSLNLTELEIRDLISKYESELRKLEYQMEKTQNTIADLRGLVTKTNYFTQASFASKTTYLPADAHVTEEIGAASTDNNQDKAETDNVNGVLVVASPRKRKKGGYRLSDWDNFVIGSLERAGRVLINADFFDLALQFARENNKDLDEKQIRGKISRSIHKLANKRGEIIKINFEGKGFAYALSEWIDSNGRLPEHYGLK